MGLITKGMGVVLKHIKKPGKAFERAGDKWFKKTKKLQASKKKSERVRGSLRVIAPMAGAGTLGAVLGAKDAKEEIKKRTHAAGQIGPARSLTEDIKAAGKKIKKKFTKK